MGAGTSPVDHPTVTEPESRYRENLPGNWPGSRYHDPSHRAARPRRCGLRSKNSPHQEYAPSRPCPGFDKLWRHFSSVSQQRYIRCRSPDFIFLGFEIVVSAFSMAPRDSFLGRETQTSWPQNGRFLIPGVNDTWNDFQKFCKATRRISTSKDWREARATLRGEYQQFIAEGGLPLRFEHQTFR